VPVAVIYYYLSLLSNTDKTVGRNAYRTSNSSLFTEADTKIETRDISHLLRQNGAVTTALTKGDFLVASQC
jgi:hypothetical protein